jgi:hypothetical protein
MGPVAANPAMGQRSHMEQVERNRLRREMEYFCQKNDEMHEKML